MLPTDPASAEQVAADDLRDFVRAATGVELPVKREDALPEEYEGTLLFIGRTQALEAAGLPGDPLEPEEYLIAAQGRAIFLAGDDSVANLQASPAWTLADRAGKRERPRWLTGEGETYFKKILPDLTVRDLLSLDPFNAKYSPVVSGTPMLWMSKPSRGGLDFDANTAVTLQFGKLPIDHSLRKRQRTGMNLVGKEGEATARRGITLEGAFGRAVVDGSEPCVRELWLRQPDGALAPKNLLNLHPPARDGFDWAVGGISYVVGADDVRYESRHSTGHRVARRNGRLTFSGVKLVAGNGKAAPLTEDWEIGVMTDGALAWRIERRWAAEFSGVFSGAPALFFNSRPNVTDIRTARGRNERPNPGGNGVITSLWFAGDGLDGFWSAYYFCTPGGRTAEPFARHLCVTVKDRDAWAVIKLYPSFPLDADLAVATGGHLYRRGSYDNFSEIGAVAAPGQSFAAVAGQVECTALTLAAHPQTETGYNLEVEIPDATVQQNLRRYYNGLLNGGTLCDMKRHDFGNETDGWRVGFTPALVAIAMAAGVPGPQPASSRPVSVAQALRESLEMRLAALLPDGRLDWGFTHEPGKVFVDYQYSLPLAADKYWLHTSDTGWLRRHFDPLAQATEVLVRNAEANDGLVGWSMDSTAAHPNWYFDGIKASGTLAYHNVFYYAALRAMARLAAAVDKREQESRYARLADEVQTAFNRLFWNDAACGLDNPAYFDWVDNDGVGHGHFMSLVQYPAIVHGLASKEQAVKMLDTANRRILVLEKENGYRGEGTLDLLWPVPQEMCSGGVARGGFGKYQNGGMLLTWTYWEIVARAQSGDAAGAWERLKRFADRAGRTNWFEGENSFTMDGQPFGWGSEPYLCDQITVPAALVDGFLGLRRDRQDFTLAPALPPGWRQMSATIQFLGQRHHLTAKADGTCSREEQS
ncbi:MAG: hypothetical protein K9N49_02025 [Candidatus Marinimicrobia bacterium]|nr:hypothetical protein [Candidatus Neomarinimicrobiota bacterium]